jgi:hypothetical protein
MPHYFRKGEREYLSKYYSSLSDDDLSYEFTQPNCEHCQDCVEHGSGLPNWCHECCTIRFDDSPLMVELSKRNINVWAVYEHWLSY